MNPPDWRNFPLDDGVLLEPVSDGTRLVVWLRCERNLEFQYWERIGSVARAEVKTADGLCTIAATLVKARQRIKRSFGQLLSALRKSRGSRHYLLPDGSSAEQCGERQSDLLLVWSEDGQPLDEAAIAARWPEGKDLRRLGKSLSLVIGVGKPPATADFVPQSQPPANPRQHAEELLAAARQAGDRGREATALADLGVILLSESNAAGAIKALEAALTIARQLGDRVRQNDVIGNLGMALLAVGQADRARKNFELELSNANAAGDQFEEKIALERLGIASWSLGDFTRALGFFQQAEAMAQRLGDRQQAAGVLWHQAIQYAELGQRDRAIAKAEESIALYKLLGKPQAAWYGAQLQKYRMGLFDEPAGPAAAGVSAPPSPHSYLGGSIVASVMAGQQPPARPAPPQQSGGPGLLRMALSATKAMTNFVGSGFKTTPPDIQQKRMQTCAACEHHTGMRCKVCGCFTQVKSRMLHEDCPIGKWPA